MKVNDIAESVFIAEAAGALFDALDIAVHPFCMPIALSEHNRIESPHRCALTVNAALRIGSSWQRNAHASQRVHAFFAHVRLRSFHNCAAKSLTAHARAVFNVPAYIASYARDSFRYGGVNLRINF